MDRPRRRASAALAVIGLLAGGCVTVPPAGYRPQSLAVSTHEVPGPRLGWGTGLHKPLEEVRGVRCTATNDRGSWTVVTPGLLAVERSATRLTITCRGDGYRDATVELPCAVPGSQAAAAMAVAPLFPPAMLILLPATALGVAVAANRDAEPNYCAYGGGSAVQVMMER